MNISLTCGVPISVKAPPSKSVSHRKMITAALAEGVTLLSNVLESDDLFRTMEVLKAAGAQISRTGKGEYHVAGMGKAPQGGTSSNVSCFMGESGTSARILTAVLAAGQGTFHIHGAGRLHSRPMADLTDALAQLGTTFHFEKAPGSLPLVLEAHGLKLPETLEWLPIAASISSQYLSGLLLAAPLASGGLRLLLTGEKTVSWPYVGLTLQAMYDAGCIFRVETYENGTWLEKDWQRLQSAFPGKTRFAVAQGTYQRVTGPAAEVEGDYSGASYLLAAGALGPNPVRVTGLRRDSLQGDAAIVDILREMGAGVAWEDNTLTVSPALLRGIDRDMGQCPDLVPTVAVLASQAKGISVLHNIAHLRDKESDRLAAPAMELAKIGCTVTVDANSMTIIPGKDDAADAVTKISSHNDHRIAMSLALLELKGLRLALDTPECVAKSFPEFWDTWRAIHPPSRISEAL